MAVTNMKTLLTNIKTIFLAARTTIGCSYWKRGILPPMPVFPCGALLPVREVVVESLTGGKYKIQRDINVEVYTKNFKVERAHEQCKDIVKEIINVAQTQNMFVANRWSDTTIDSTWSSEIYETPFEFSNQIVQVGVLPMTFISEETLPTSRPVTSAVTETDQSDLIDYIYTLLTGYINGTDATFDLTMVKKIYKKEIPPIPVYPAATVVGRGLLRERIQSSGLDTPLHSVEIGIFTKLLDKEVLLDRNLDIVEIMKDIFQYNEDLGGRCVDSNIDEILYDRQDITSLGLVYRSRINLEVETVEYITI